MNLVEGMTKLCKRITGGDPIVVPNRPEQWVKEGYCFANVKRQIEEHGGSGQFGWLFHELAGILTAVHHQVWRSPEGELVCVTPQEESTTVMRPVGIVFLPDDTATLSKPAGCESGLARPNRYMAMTRNKRVRAIVRSATQGKYEYGQQVQAMMKA